MFAFGGFILQEQLMLLTLMPSHFFLLVQLMCFACKKGTVNGNITFRCCNVAYSEYACYRCVDLQYFEQIYLGQCIYLTNFLSLGVSSLDLPLDLSSISPLKLMPNTKQIYSYNPPHTNIHAPCLPYCRTPSLLPNGNDFSVSPSLRRRGALVIYYCITSHPKTQ